VHEIVSIRGAATFAQLRRSWLKVMEPKHHVAVVDDEVDLRTSVAEYLQLQGFAVSQAADGPGLLCVDQDAELL